jgi:ComF family protein
MRYSGFFTQALNYFFPSFCLICGCRVPEGDNLSVCTACINLAATIIRPSCPGCGRPFATPSGDSHVCGESLHSRSALASVRALGTYEGTLRTLIHYIKYKRKFSVVGVLEYLLDQYSQRFADIVPHDVIIPVPLHPRRLRERGFNQALLWGEVVGAQYSVPIDRNLLRRTKWTKPQVSLHGNTRKNNVRNAFSAKENSHLDNAAVLLVDDVYTTGATMGECARILRTAGASRVDGFVIARAV